MRLLKFLRPALSGLPALSAAVLMTSCSPAVSDADLSSAKSRAAAKRDEASRLEAELKSLNAEVKTLGGFTGKEHDDRVARVKELNDEKERMASLKAEIDGKVADFEARTKKVREQLAAGNK